MKSSEKSEPSKGRVRVIGAAAILAIVISAGATVYLKQIAPFRVTVVVVDQHSIKMGYFLKRVHLEGGDSMATINTLISEQIVDEIAPEPPYNVVVTEKDVDTYLRSLAQGKGSPLTDVEYREWYLQQLNDSRLSSQEFRDIARTHLLANGLRDYLANHVQTVTEQVHLHFMTLDSRQSALVAESRINSGVSFARVAHEMAADASRTTGGDVGWVPRLALPSHLASVAFSNIEIGRCSEPIRLGGGKVGLLMVSARSAAREIDPRLMGAIRANVLNQWLEKQQPLHHVEIHGLYHNSYDSQTDAWVSSQLQKMGPIRKGTP